MKSIYLLLILLLVLLEAKAQSNAIVQLSGHYLKIYEALINGEADLAQREAALLKAGLFLPAELEGETMQVYNKALPVLLKQSNIIASSKNLQVQRNAFNELSISLWEVIQVDPESQNEFYYFYCPMKQAYWISDSATGENPYYGPEMRTCSTLNDSL